MRRGWPRRITLFSRLAPWTMMGILWSFLKPMPAARSEPARSGKTARARAAFFRNRGKRFMTATQNRFLEPFLIGNVWRQTTCARFLLINCPEKYRPVKQKVAGHV